VAAKITVSGLAQGPVEVDDMRKAFELIQSQEFFTAKACLSIEDVSQEADCGLAAFEP
jgi:hypothetical protein